MKQFKFSSFLAGVLVTVLTFTVVVPVMAAFAKKNIEVYTGVRIYVDDKLIQPKDANGNTVEPFLYNGTTYLPIRAIGSAFGKAVSWDGKTQSAYVGKHESSEPTVMLADLDYFSGTKDVEKIGSDQDNLGNTHYNVLDSWHDNWSRKYMLNGQYTHLSGTFYQQYGDRSRSIWSGQGLDIYGDGKILYSVKTNDNTTGFLPREFDVDLTGVIELEIVVTGSYFGFALGDCGLYT